MIRATVAAAFAGILSMPVLAHAAGGGVTDYGQPGTIEVGGTVSFSSGSTTIKPKGGGSSQTDTTTTIFFGPTGGYFLTDSVELLGDIVYGSSSDKISGGGGTTSSSVIALRVGGGYYFAAGDSGMKVGPDLKIGFASVSDDFGGGNKADAAGLVALPGVTFKAPMGKDKGAVLSAGLHYDYESLSGKDKSAGGSVDVTNNTGDIILDAAFTYFFK